MVFFLRVKFVYKRGLPHRFTTTGHQTNRCSLADDTRVSRCRIPSHCPQHAGVTNLSLLITFLHPSRIAHAWRTASSATIDSTTHPWVGGQHEWQARGNVIESAQESVTSSTRRRDEVRQVYQNGGVSLLGRPIRRLQTA